MIGDRRNLYNHQSENLAFTAEFPANVNDRIHIPTRHP